MITKGDMEIIKKRFGLGKSVIKFNMEINEKNQAREKAQFKFNIPLIDEPGDGYLIGSGSPGNAG